ncbi:hypothetical protein MTO96_017456 [Rhipicephalus appendiculatus]
MSNCPPGYEAAERMTDLPKLHSFGNATQAERRQEMLVTEDETMVEVFHGRDEPERFPRAEIDGDFSDDGYDEFVDYDD